MTNQEQGSTSQDHRYLKPKTPYTSPEERAVELFARIKKSSEYYHQGLDQNNNPLLFKVEGIRSGHLCFRLNYNSYASHDLAFYVKDSQGSFVPLSGIKRVNKK